MNSPASRLATACRVFYGKNPAVCGLFLLGALIDSMIGVACALIESPVWAPLPAAIAIGSAYLLVRDPGGEP